MTKPHKERAHARLAPSASHRWIECPGSINATEGIESTSSVFANEGTAAHELAGHCLSNNYDADKFAGFVIDITGKTFGERLLWPNSPITNESTQFLVDDEMVEGVQVYLDYVRSFIPDHYKVEVEYETRLDMRHVHPDVFGTGDTVLFDPKAKWLHVFDLKYGRGVVVEVEENPQLLTYGIGTAHRFHNRQVEGITLHIVQPRAHHKDGPCRSWEADLVTLLEFEDELAKAAKATEAPDAPRIPGPWCQFCPALPTCPEAREKATKMALDEFTDDDGFIPATQMTDEQLAQVLREAGFIFDWIKSVQAHAHAQAVAGKPPRGYKLVQKRAMRKWINEGEARDELSSIFGDDVILTDPKLKSPAQLEKVLGKREYEQTAECLVHKVSSGTNLVPVTDPRPAAKNAGMEDFA